MYSVYWYIFEEYKGKDISAQYKAKAPYQGVLYKVGHQMGEEQFGRVEKNRVLDEGKRPVWVGLWNSIRCGGLLTGFATKEEAIKVEEDILYKLGPKDFNLYENISGIREFRIANIERRDILRSIFDKGL